MTKFEIMSFEGSSECKGEHTFFTS